MIVITIDDDFCENTVRVFKQQDPKLATEINRYLADNSEEVYEEFATKNQWNIGPFDSRPTVTNICCLEFNPRCIIVGGRYWCW